MHMHLIRYPPYSLKAGYAVRSILQYRITGLIPSRSQNVGIVSLTTLFWLSFHKVGSPR
jgi:hypothetical protein